MKRRNASLRSSSLEISLDGDKNESPRVEIQRFLLPRTYGFIFVTFVLDVE